MGSSPPLVGVLRTLTPKGDVGAAPAVKQSSALSSPEAPKLWERTEVLDFSVFSPLFLDDLAVLFGGERRDGWPFWYWNYVPLFLFFLFSR